jgi:hypothetical protein
LGIIGLTIALEIINSGVWWLPEKPDCKLSGQLTYKSGNKAILSLNGMFDEKIEFHEIILGNIDDCKVTLVNCMRISWRKTLSGTGDSSSSEFDLIAICKGHHFVKKADLIFNTISVRYSYLRRWLGGKISGAHMKEHDPYLKQSIEKPFIANILPELTIKIEGFLERDQYFYYSPYNEETYVIFYLKNERLTELLKKLDIFRNFFAICIDEKISFYAIEAQEEYGNVQIILPSILQPIKDDHSYLIPFPIEPKLFLKNAKLYLENWYSFAKKFEPVYQLFFSENFEQLYLTTRFLNYAQAIEAYHGRKYENRFFPDNIREMLDKFTNFSDFVKIVFPKSFRDAILSKFQFLNRKTLRMILRDFFGDFKELFSIFIKDNEDFIERFVKTRNYYTHYDPSAKEPTYKQILVLTENARFILLSIFLKEIGLNEDDIRQAIYRYCRKRIREIKSL